MMIVTRSPTEEMTEKEKLHEDEKKTLEKSESAGSLGDEDRERELIVRCLNLMVQGRPTQPHTPKVTLNTTNILIKLSLQ